MIDLKAFEISLSRIRRIIGDFQLEMERGLFGRKSSLKMIPTYAYRPTGGETGKFIALDLGGTNFRILELRLLGAGKIGARKIMKFTLAKKHITGSREIFFGFIAGCVKVFLKKYKLESERELDLGFTFSFPVKQTGIAGGTLVCWTKDFNVNGVIGNDVVVLLKKALVKKGIRNVKIAALANDTVGTLVAKSYQDRNCDVGVIIGTGTNACYPEARLGGMIINAEWGNFDKLKLTAYDRELDKKSDNPGRQIMEKAVSGMYLGRIASLVVKDLLGSGAELKTEDMSLIESDHSAGLAKAASVLRRAGLVKCTPEERRQVKNICETVSRRGARISAACIGAMIKRMDTSLSRRHTVAIDGSVYEKHPTFAKNMKSCLREMFGSKSNLIKITLTKDGSGRGAAIIAAVAASR
ncbi:MAG: hexokinase [Candidatus Omnitrophota bacterium]